MAEAALTAAAGAPAPAPASVAALRPRSPPLAPGRGHSSHPPCCSTPSRCSPCAVPQAGAAPRQPGGCQRDAQMPDTGLFKSI